MIQLNATVNDAAITAALRKLALTTSNLQPALRDIGGALEASTQERFFDETAPDGTPWEEHSDATKAKRGDGAEKLREAGHLFDSISSHVSGASLAVGVNRVYGRIHQLGGEAGRNHSVKIEARPYLGVDAQDERTIFETLESYLQEAVGS